MAIRDCPWDQPSPNKVHLANIVCVAYGHPDLSKAHKNLLDFGFFESNRTGSGDDETIFYRGYGVQPVAYIAKKTPKPVFLGSHFEVESAEDWGRALKVEGAGEMEPFLDGKVVQITDPQGLPFNVVYGYQKRDFTPRETDQNLPMNFPSAIDSAEPESKPRRGVTQRFKSGSTPIHKLGHVGYVVDDLATVVDFYTRNFNFKPSDIMLGQPPARQPMLLFLHLDRGKKYTDHHCFFLAQAHGEFKGGQPHHAAFETENVDAQFIGHEHLEKEGYTSWWGIGRHIEGSQIFDYWYDVDYFIIERYADGDVVNEDFPVGWNDMRKPADNVNWGPLRPALT